jgi:hypothetical protein
MAMKDEFVECNNERTSASTQAKASSTWLPAQQQPMTRPGRNQ